MLDDLRPVVADILCQQGYRLPPGEALDARAMRLFDGAETLLWVHDRETTARGDEAAELETLREFVADLGELLADPTVGGGKRRVSVATLRDHVDAIATLHATVAWGGGRP